MSFLALALSGTLSWQEKKRSGPGLIVSPHKVRCTVWFRMVPEGRFGRRAENEAPVCLQPVRKIGGGRESDVSSTGIELKKRTRRF